MLPITNRSRDVCSHELSLCGCRLVDMRHGTSISRASVQSDRNEACEMAEDRGQRRHLEAPAHVLCIQCLVHALSCASDVHLKSDVHLHMSCYILQQASGTRDTRYSTRQAGAAESLTHK